MGCAGEQSVAKLPRSDSEGTVSTVFDDHTLAHPPAAPTEDGCPKRPRSPGGTMPAPESYSNESGRQDVDRELRQSGTMPACSAAAESQDAPLLDNTALQSSGGKPFNPFDEDV